MTIFNACYVTYFEVMQGSGWLCCESCEYVSSPRFKKEVKVVGSWGEGSWSVARITHIGVHFHLTLLRAMLEFDWVLFIVTSNMPCVDITSSMFLRDSGIASYCVCVCVCVCARACECVSECLCVHCLQVL